MRKGNEKVFVYGTLKPGFQFGNLYLSQWEHSGPEMINGDLHMVNCGTYAGLNLDSTNRLSGYVFNVDQRMLKVLDRVEGCPDFYRRAKTKLLSNGEDVWVYEYTHRDEFNGNNYISHGKFEYVKGLTIQIPLLETQTDSEYVRVMLGGMALDIENPLDCGGNPRLPEAIIDHPSPKVNVSIKGKKPIEALFLNPFNFYDHEKEGIDLMLPSGEIVTGIPVNEVEFIDE